ncbi:MAG TPA: ATP-binding protein [Chitinophagaceae bacterium]
MDWNHTPMLLESTLSRQGKLMDGYEVFLKFGTWEYSLDTTAILWSVGMYHLFGYDPVKDKDLVIDEALYEKHIDATDYKKGLVQRKEAYVNNTEYFWQYRITTNTGELRWLETYGNFMRDQDGKITNIVGLTRDITRLKIYEHSLETKIRELNRSNAELEEFAYVASHDMQEPLRKLITFSERLTAKFENILQEEGKLYVNRMVAAANNMRLLIDNLLDFSRVARVSDAFVATNLNEILNKGLADMEVSIEETGAQIIAEPLPVVEAHPEQMKQLLVNIISNAIKFRKPGVPPIISIQCEVVADNEADVLGPSGLKKYYRIRIIDNGIGFEQEYAEKIFQIFQRLHGKAEYPGSGIGLAICKKIVDYHNGIIYARGELGKGATITIILPEKQ